MNEKTKITKGTIIRTIALALVLLNFILEKTGHPILNISESEIGSFVEMAVSAATIIVCWWKNNSYSKKAIKADNFLKHLRQE